MPERRLGPAKQPITLRHLLTHTAGFGYEFDNADLVRYVKATSTPPTSTGKLAALRLPIRVSAGNTASTSIRSAARSKR